MIGYLRVSTEQQGDNGHGLDAQRDAIAAEAMRRAWEVQWVEDVASGKSMSRVGLAYALHLLDEGQADGIVTSHLDRLSRSVLDFSTLLVRAAAGRWNVVVLDLGLDLTTPHGEFTAHVLSAAAQLERRMIGVRTREALAAARERGQILGRPRSTPEHVVARIQRERAQGMTLQAIADGLNADGVPTARNGTCWQRGTIGRLVAIRG
jgi:DNA invertase Pin-like site-specific DNA recombinase